MLLAVYLHETFIDIEDVAIAPVLSLQLLSVNGTKFDTPETNRFATDCDATIGNRSSLSRWLILNR